MTKAAYLILACLAIAGAFLAGSWHTQRGAVAPAAPGARKVLYYVDPMHPAYKSDKPGIAPDCGMELVPVYEDGSMGASGSSPSGPPGSVKVSPERQQLIGVRVSAVEKAAGTRALRVFGRVAPDETRLYKINAGIEGFIREVSAVTTGDHVKKDQLLATFSSPNAYNVIQLYILNLGAVDRLREKSREGSVEAQAAGAGASNIQQRVDQMENLGMSPLQMEEIQRTRQVPASIQILAPADGFVLARNVSPGQKFERGAELFRIADLSRAWILADVFETEAQYLRPGVHAQASLAGQRKTFPATVAEVLPQFDANTRTLKVRLEAENPGFVLRPDMFVDVELPITLPPVIAVPVDAVLDSGLKKTVFVDRGEGFFEPRPVETGWRLGDRVEIVKGLAPGDRIVVSSTFLLDSESRMKLAAAGIPGATSTDPVCGMEVDEGKARATGRTSEYGDRTYYFCSEADKQAFDKDPARYAAKHAKDAAQRDTSSPKPARLKGGSAVPAVARAFASQIDPVCGMEVDEGKARAAGQTSEYGGRTYYFCSDGDKQDFDKDPARYAGTPAHAGDGHGSHGHGGRLP